MGQATAVTAWARRVLRLGGGSENLGHLEFSTSRRQHHRLPNGSGLSKNGGEGLSEGGLIDRRKPSKLFEHKRWINGGEDRFEDGGFE